MRYLYTILSVFLLWQNVQRGIEGLKFLSEKKFFELQFQK